MIEGLQVRVPSLTPISVWKIPDRQQFLHAIVPISAPYWSEGLSFFENVVDTPFEFGL